LAAAVQNPPGAAAEYVAVTVLPSDEVVASTSVTISGASPEPVRTTVTSLPSTVEAFMPASSE
jgi:hypothetical protein